MSGRGLDDHPGATSTNVEAFLRSCSKSSGDQRPAWHLDLLPRFARTHRAAEGCPSAGGARSAPFAVASAVLFAETVTGVVDGLTGAPISALTVSVGLAAVGVGCGVWWTYFDIAGHRHPRPTRSRPAVDARHASMNAALVYQHRSGRP